MRKALLSVVFIFLATMIDAQNQTTDSLKRVLSTQKEDTNKVNTLIQLSGKFRMQANTAMSLQHSKEALVLADRLNFAKGKGWAYRELGFANTIEDPFASLHYHDLSLQCFQLINSKRDCAYSLLYIGTHYRNRRNYPMAFVHFSNALKQFEALKDRGSIAHCYVQIAGLYSDQSNYPDAIKYFYNALKVYERLGDKQDISTCLNRIGWAHQMQANFSEAVSSYSRSLKIWEELGNKIEVARVNNFIGSAYARQEKYQDALEKHLTALNIAKEVKNVSWLLPMTQARLGDDYEMLANIADTSGDKTTATKMYAEALQNYADALKANKALSSEVGVADVSWHYGSIYTKLKKYDLARSYFEKALELYKATGMKGFVSLTYERLSKLDSIEGDFQKAYQHYKTHRQYLDSVFNEETVRKTERARMQYLFDKKEDSIEMHQALTLEKLKQQQLLAVQQQQQLQLQQASLMVSNQQNELNRLAFLGAQTQLQAEQSDRKEKEKQILIVEKEKALEHATLKLKTTELVSKEKEINAKRMERNIIVAGALAILILGLTLYRNNQQKQIAYSLLEKQRMRTQIASDLHDNIGSELTSISFYSEMVKMQLREGDCSSHTILDKIGNNARTIVNTMNDIVWVINPDNDLTENLIMRMRNHGSEVCNERNIELQFYADNEAGDLKLNMQQRKNLYLIYKEALHNAVKYADCDKIKIGLSKTDWEVQLLIKDNGHGFDLNTAREGNGLTNMKRRAEEINGTLHLTTCPNKGTSVILNLKIT